MAETREARTGRGKQAGDAVEPLSGKGTRRTMGGELLESVAELFDLPADVVARLPRLELIGSRQLYLEHHRGILSYSEERIDANTTAGILRIGGERLTLLAMTDGELRVGGRILSLEWIHGAE